MRFVQLNTAATLAFDLPLRADSGATFVVKAPDGSTIQSATAATRNAVDTTVNGAVAAGATTITVLSATGVVVGGSYIIGSAGNGTATREDLGGEVITVKSKNGTVLTLVRPLFRAHASGELFQSRQVSCAISSSTPTVVGRHWRIEVTFSADDGTSGSTVAQPAFVVPFDVTRFCPVSSLVENDVGDLDPVIGKRLPAGLWWPALRDRAWDMILRRVSQQVAPGALVGAIDLTTPHLYLCRELLAETAGEAWEPYRMRMAERFGEELNAALASTPIDTNQDGAVSSNEGWFRSVQVNRG